MPVTVKELIIRANISSNDGNVHPKAISSGGGASKLDKEVIIKEAVRRVMEELSYKTGR